MTNRILSLFTNHKALIITLFLNLVVVFLPLINDQFIKVHDFTGGGRLYTLQVALQDGHFPPRWAKDFGFGYGMPLFQFYAPAFFYSAQVFHWIGLSIPTSLKLTLLLSTILGFVGMFLLVRKLLNKPAGLIAATAFTLAPYHAVNFYVRGAFAEYSAISFFPWILLFTIQLIKLKRIQLKSAKKILYYKPLIINYVGLTFFIACLLLTHNVTMLTFIPLWVLFTAILIVSFQKWNTIPIFFVSSIHALAIAAFFLIPSIATKSFTRVDEITGGYSAYELHFLYFRQLFIPNWGYGGSIWGLGDDMSFYLGWDIIILSALSSILVCVMLFITLKTSIPPKIKNQRNSHIKQYSYKILNGYSLLVNKKNSKYYIYLVIGIFFLGSIFLTSFKSKIIWDNLHLLSYIQFPWRFLGVATFFLAILAGFTAASKYIQKIWYIPVAIIITLNFQYFTPNEIIMIDRSYDPYPTYIQEELSSILPDYLPAGINWKEIEPLEEVIEFKSDGGDEELIENITHRITVQTQSDNEGTLIFNRFVFPNWKFSINDQPLECEVVDFVYHCPVPAGQHRVTMNWSEEGINAISNTISLVGFTLWTMIAIHSYRKTGKTKK